MRTETRSGNRAQPSRKATTAKHARHNKRGVQNANFDGIHHRRDKRYPLGAARPRPEEIAELSEEILDSPEDEIDSDEIKWKEALMLWLSWNSTYEKVTARMCKPGQDQQKLEAMMDEMDRLRRQAIDLSEKLIA